MDKKKLYLEGEGEEFVHGHLGVECPYPMQSIEELSVTGRLDEHGRVWVKGILRHEAALDCIRHVGSRDPILVYAEKGGKRTTLFSGVITTVDISCREDVYSVAIEGLSWSSLLDYGEKCRSFPDGKEICAKIISEVLSAYEKSYFMDADHLARQETGQLLLQYRETDWAFLRRLATQLHTHLTADTTGDGPGFWFGLPKNRRKIASVGEVVLEKDMDAYYEAAASGFPVKEEQFVRYRIRSSVRLGLGAMTEYEGRPLIVAESCMVLRQGVLQYHYVLAAEPSLIVSRKNNPYIQGISLQGEVLDRRNRQLKVRLQTDGATERAGWFSYATQAGSVCDCMPEVGSVVSVYFPDSDERSAIAVNDVRQNGGSCAKTSNPAVKYLETKDGQELRLGGGELGFTAHEALFLKLRETDGVLLQSHMDLDLFTRQKLSLEAKELVRIFARTGNILVGAKGESSLYLMGGANGETHLKAGAGLIYEGRRKEVFSERLNQAIAYKEKSFDWGKLLLNVLIGLAAVAVAVAAVVTGGAALVAAGAVAQATVASAAIGAAIGGTISVGVKAISDVARGEVSAPQDYALAGVKGAVEGAVAGAVLGVPALQGAGLLTKMFASGGVSFVTDGISQGIDICFQGGAYHWEEGLLSFGVGFMMPAASAAIRKGARKILEKFGKNMPQWLERAFCKLGGDPVDLVSGNVIYDTIDFELPGPIPLQWRRIWCSASRITGHLGHGTRYSYEMGLEVSEDGLVAMVFLNDGRVGVFPNILVGEEFFSDYNRLVLRRHEDHYELFDPQTRYSYLLYPGEGGYLPYKLTKLQNRQGHQIEFFYDRSGYLCRIIDSAGRALKVTTNENGRITRVACMEGEKEGQMLVAYAYHETQELGTITDAVGADICLEYREHLLVKKTDRNKHSFYWRYDKYEDGARAVRTWGDGDVLSLWLEYHDEDRYNTVKTSRESPPSQYHYDKRWLCTRIVYPDFTERREEYNDRYQLVRVIDEEGRLTQYQYNDWSQITEIIRADASRICFGYDEEGRLAALKNPEGGCRRWTYHADDALKKIIDEAGCETFYQYNAQRLVEKIVFANGAKVRLAYDGDLNLCKATLPDGSFSSWVYDGMGNCLTERNAAGAVWEYRYDRKNRMTGARLPDGNEIQLAYDGYESVVHAKDRQTEVSFTYTILGSVASRSEGGHSTVYEYNGREELVSVTNENGEVYRLERDAKGRVVKEIGYDGVIRTYERDYSGLVTKICRPGGRYTSYQRDSLGRIIRADYQDHTYETFTYDKNGAITEAANQYEKVKIERDSLGRVIREWQGERWIASRYDGLGNRIRTESSFGANILSERNELGALVHLTAYRQKERAWSARMQYNAYGAETQRLFSNGISSCWEYDVAGRPVFHEVRGSSAPDALGVGKVFEARRYRWDVNHRLQEITNELTRERAVFSYENAGRFICARERGFETIFRTMDAVGNLYETRDCSDRIYGAGSRLEQSGIDRKEMRNQYQGGFGRLVTKGRTFFYDEEGNLAKKVEPDGSTWTYAYFGNGMLREVIRPDQSRVCFQYDAFGRRTEKSVTKTARKDHGKKRRQKVTRFLWNGNALLHEWEEMRTEETKASDVRVDYRAEFLLKMEQREAERRRREAEQGEKTPMSLITWIFEDDLIPRGKLTEKQNYSIISDYLGTPERVYDESGKEVWERALDFYGRVKDAPKDRYGRAGRRVGEGKLIPFRFQGQYEDEETGLYYNRFRYYDLKEGCYTQQDPIGLAGGNPTLYGYVSDPLCELDPFGLVWDDLRPGGLGHHLFPRSVAKKLGIGELAQLTALSWYPNDAAGSGLLHQKMHRALIEQGVPYHGSKFTGTIDDFWKMAHRAYEGIEAKGYLKIPRAKDSQVFENLTPQEAIHKIKDLYDKEKIQTIHAVHCK